MRISIRKKTSKPIFIHINKNAGTSIIQSAHNSITVAGHRTANDWLTENGYKAPLFTVIRNPFDRVVSEYFFRKRRYDAGENNPHLSNLYKSFEEWVIATFCDGEFRTYEFFEKSGIFYNSNNMIGNTLIWFLPQKYWISNPDGKILVDHILRYENLNEDWKCFSSKYQINRVLKHQNSSQRERGYQQYYSTRTRNIVKDYFHDDLDIFDYQF